MMIEESLNPDPLVRETRVHRELTIHQSSCAECVRLFEQARAALLIGDRSRLSDVRVYQRRHNEAEHASSQREGGHSCE